jgi:hypothetical protein
VSVLGDYHMNGGYDWMELIEAEGWAVVPSWGCDGWDLGQWPYPMVAARRTADSIGNLFGVATYCEGDVSCTFYRTTARQWEAITEQAFFHWKNGQAHGPDDLPEAAAELRPATGSPTQSTPPDQRHGRCPANYGGAPHPPNHLRGQHPMSTCTALIIPADGHEPARIETIDASLENLQTLVAGNIEAVSGYDWHFYLNEDGKPPRSAAGP